MTFQSELPKLVLPSGDLRALPSTLGEGGESAISHMGSTQALLSQEGGNWSWRFYGIVQARSSEENNRRTVIIGRVCTQLALSPKFNPWDR